jgi:hypothetical protein
VQPVSEFIIEAYCDSSFGKHAQVGYIVGVNGAPVLWRSGKQRCVTLSTVKAELRATYDCMDSLVLIMYMFAQFRVPCTVRVYSDAKDLVSLILSPHPKPAEKHLLIEIRRLQSSLEGDVSARASQLHSVSARRKANDESDCVQLVQAIQDLALYMPDVPILLEHIPGATNPADALTKPVDVRYLASKYLCTF